MRVEARVPMRVDFAGSTLDVYPLYLFEGGGLTLNAAVNIMAMATVETRDDRQIVICSQDLGCDEAIPSLEDMQFGGPLDLVKRALAYYRPSVGLDILVASQAPKGSGLGGSSALLMALSSCLNRVAERGLARGQIIDVGANIEAQVIGIPTGKQDYFPPMFGGVCAMWFDVDGWEFESLSQEGDLLAELNRRMVVSYTGIPHFSSVTNWAMLKRYIEDEGDTVARMKEIKQIAVEMRDCLLGGDMAAFARMVDAEWQLRRGLAEGVTTPEIDAIMAAAADAGALASKICGAGGGGCMITVSEPGRLQPVRQALTAAGARVMEAQLVSQGIQLR